MTLPPQAGPEGEATATLRSIPEATVARLAVYLRMLGELAERGAETVSSEELATATGVNSAKLRKDLSYIGINGIVVEHVCAIPEVCAERGITIGIISTPGPAAQGVCDLLVQAGVECILNFAPVVLQVPEQVEVSRVDLAVELQILAFHVARRYAPETVEGAAIGHRVNGHAPAGSVMLP